MRSKKFNLIVLCVLLFGFFSCEDDNPEPNEPCDEQIWYQDADGDGLGNPAVFVSSCEQPTGFVSNNLDDDDTGGGSGGDEPIQLDCSSLQTTQTLVDGPNEIDYIVTCGIEITAAISIDPGVVIAFQEGTYFHVTSGSLEAKGEDDNEIIFRGVNEVSGYWDGILYQSNSNDNELEHVIIKDAGFSNIICCDAPFSLEVLSGRLRMSNVTITNGSSYGLAIRPDARVNTFNNININTHEEAPVVIEVNSVGLLNNEGCDFSGNEDDFIYVYGRSIDESINFRKQSVPYYYSESNSILSVNDAVTLDPGVTILMADRSSIWVDETGSLEADGQEMDKITIRGETASPGFWEGILFESNNSRNNLNHVDIAHAGGGSISIYPAASLLLYEGQISIKNLTISDGADEGIIMKRDISINEYSNVSVSGHAGAPLSCDLSNVNDLDGMGSDYSGNDFPAIVVNFGDVQSSLRIPRMNVPYDFADDMEIGAATTIEPGTELTFRATGSLYINNTGSLEAVGTQSSPIIFRGTSMGSSNFWPGILIQSNNTNNRLQFFEIDGAGNGWIQCCNGENGLRVENGRLEVSDGVLRNINGCGISYDEDAQMFIGSNLTYDNVSDPECLD